jgi:apolipoprotein N-acyltransferase
VLINLGLVLVGSLIFALSFPSFLSEAGWFPLAFIALVPVFILVHRSGWIGIAFYGLLYGFCSYSIFNFWLVTFHPLSIFIVPTIYAAYFFLLFPVLKLADTLFPRYGFLVQTVIWVAYEYLRTRGFHGYPYGIIGYSQYTFLPLIQIVSVTGVWGVCYLVVFPSALLGNAVAKGFDAVTAGRGSSEGITEPSMERPAYEEHEADDAGEAISSTGTWLEVLNFLQARYLAAIVYGCVFVAVLVYGFISPVDLENDRRWKVALVQHNADTWEYGLRSYSSNLDILIRLSNEALKEDPDIVIWSETAFVPGIDWHTRRRTNREYYELVLRLREFLDAQDTPFVFGNDDRQLPEPEDGDVDYVDYNAVVLYQDGELKQTYRKIHLVPFTENFPHKDLFPRFYQILVDNDYHFWKRGTEWTVFEVDGIKFSTPICFEDVFGYLSREFVRRGADVIINLTNDSWSGSVAAQMQHLQISVFRAVENRRSLIRGTNSGMTCSIDPNGRIDNELAPFTEGYITGYVPIHTDTETLFTKWGDWLAYWSIRGSIGILLGGILLFVSGRAGRRKQPA